MKKARIKVIYSERKLDNVGKAILAQSIVWTVFCLLWMASIIMSALQEGEK